LESHAASALHWCHLLPFFMFMTGGRHLLARLAASFLIAASIEIDDGNDQETNGQTAEEDDENLFRQILRHSDRTLSERRIRLKLQIDHHENGVGPKPRAIVDPPMV
jgi:hypothetical protein